MCKAPKEPGVSEKHAELLRLAADLGTEFASLPVSCFEDVQKARAILDDVGSGTKLIAKIDSAAGLMNIDDIAVASDGILLDRGALGWEITPAKLALAQNLVTTKANLEGKLVLTSSEFLQSMLSNPRPTRAEMTDVANAVFQGSGALVLGEETSKGAFPAMSVRTMCDIV